MYFCVIEFVSKQKIVKVISIHCIIKIGRCQKDSWHAHAQILCPKYFFCILCSRYILNYFFFLGNFLYITCWRVYYNAVVISQFFSCVFARFPRQKKIHQSPHFRFMKKLTSCQLLHFRLCLVYGAVRILLKLYLSDELWEPIHIITGKMKNIF